jgi:flagellar biosynthetic protein FliR
MSAVTSSAPLAAILAGFLLVLARTAALVLAAPVLGQGTGFTGYRVGLITFLALLLYLVAGAPVEAAPLELGLMLLREVVIGIFLGFLLQLVLLAVRVAGELVGQEMGFLVARQVDPTSGVASSLVTNLYENLFLMVLLALDGHHWLLRSLERSFAFAPPGRIALGRSVAPTALAMFAEMFRAGLVFAAPVMAFLLLVSLLIGILARAVPGLNVLEIGFTLRVLVALAAMFLFAPLMGPALNSLHQDFLRWLERGLASL